MANSSEKQLKEFCKFHKNLPKHLRLKGQGDLSVISPLKRNLCTVTLTYPSETVSRDFLFGGISEKFYDKIVKEYHTDK